MKKTMILMVLFLGCLMPASAQTQLEMNLAELKKYQIADDELNQVYRKIQEVYREDTLFLQKLKSAQLAWIKFRDLHLESLYPEEDKALHYGSVYPTCRYIVLTELTKARTVQLRVWLKGLPQGDVCSGSVKSGK